MPNFPDPTPATTQGPSESGKTLVITFGNEQFVLTNPEPSRGGFRSAMKACHNIVGMPLGPTRTTVSPKQQQAWVATAAYMRTSGFPTFPDPQFKTNGYPPPQGGNGGGHPAAIDIDGAFFDLGLRPTVAAVPVCLQRVSEEGGVDWERPAWREWGHVSTESARRREVRGRPHRVKSEASCGDRSPGHQPSHYHFRPLNWALRPDYALARGLRRGNLPSPSGDNDAITVCLGGGAIGYAGVRRGLLRSSRLDPDPANNREGSLIGVFSRLAAGSDHRGCRYRQSRGCGLRLHPDAEHYAGAT